MVKGKLLKHYNQGDRITCGACAYACLISDVELISEKQACDECKTTKRGTSVIDVAIALNKRGIQHERIYLNDVDFRDYFHILDNLSQHHKVYVSGEYRDRPDGGGRGRERVRHHAFVVYKGMVYDSGESQVLPVDSYFHSFSKRMMIKDILVV